MTANLQTLDDVSCQAEKPCRIVVMEWSQSAAQILRLFLERDGHEVKVAMTGRDGLELVASMKPDIVFSSLSVFDLDGYEVAQEIRRSLPYHPLLVAMSSSGRHFVQARAKEAGFDLFLPKPYHREDLLKTISCVEDRTAHAELWL